jgi:hypothetical protein
MRFSKQTVHTKKDGSFDLNISTPLHDKEVEVVVIINEKPSYNFSGLIGKLRWKGDPLKMQKKLRDEWQ